MSCTCDRPFPEQPPSCNPLHNVHSLLTYSFDSSSVSDAPAMLRVVPRQFAIIFTVNGDSHARLQRFQRIGPAGDKWDQEFRRVLRFRDWHWRLNLLGLRWPFRRSQSEQLSDRVFWQIILFPCSIEIVPRTPPQACLLTLAINSSTSSTATAFESSAEQFYLWVASFFMCFWLKKEEYESKESINWWKQRKTH